MNTKPSHPADAAQRAEALDLERSFIVQAPAGSGKTELLTQRFLKLLARVDRPERLLAITFTRKATFEMRARILKRLQQAAAGIGRHSDDVPDHERIAIGFAREALRRDADSGWDLLRNPGRLRVLTIDSLCAQFLARDPGQGALGAGLAVREDAEPLYREAVERLFDTLGSTAREADAWSEARAALTRVLVHLDADGRVLRQLLVDKLRSRDQWVHRIGTDEGTLAEVMRGRQQAELARLERALGAEALAQALDLAARLGAACEPGSPAAVYADDMGGITANSESAHTGDTGDTGDTADSGDITDSGTNDGDRMRQAWRFARMFRKSSGGLYAPSSLKRFVFKNLPPELDGTREALLALYQSWFDDARTTAALVRVADHSPVELGDDTLPLQQDIVTVLKLALAELRVLFSERGECDFHFMTELALESLGEEDAPGSLLLAEDQRLGHILMDEFQDTSNTQFELLRRLVAGWSGEAGRSLFLVGDPMQSIYRFREANVGLFIDVVEHGRLGEVRLEYLQLRSNFRSRTEVVDWVNREFARVFPPQDERDSGAVRYARAHAEKGAGGRVELHALPDEATHADEAERVVELVRQARSELDDPTIAILARARTHLAEIARALQRHSIEAQAVKVDRLADRPVVLDLLALTRALLHPADRIAWLAVLRAPWCGLTVAELQRVAGADPRADLLERIREAGDADARFTASCRRVAQVMSLAESRRGAAGLRDRVETAWLLLGGPLCYGSEAELDHAGAFLDLLERNERQGGENLLARLDEQMKELYAGSRPSKLQLMTIHQAKGLEFDVVIVPGLQRPPRSADRELVALQEFRLDDDRDAALLAPCPPRAKPEASLYDYLAAVDAERGAFELQRLLYVACTRPRHALHLLAQCKEKKDGSLSAPSNTFLELLAPAFEHAIEQGTADSIPARPEDDRADAWARPATAADAGDQSVASGNGAPDVSTTPGDPEPFPLLRLENAPLPDLPKAPATPDDELVVLPELPSRESVALGSALHEWLELVHDHWQRGWEPEWFERHQAALTATLRRAGFSAAEAEKRVPELLDLLTKALTTEAGQSVVSPESKAGSWAELPVVQRDGPRLKRYVIDRLYRSTDGEWTIADYKTGSETADTRDRWQQQLGRYRQLIEAASNQPVGSAGIYLAPTAEWIELAAEKT